MKYQLFVSMLCFVFVCSVFSESMPGHGQGEMAGEVTADSVILQSRLTVGDRLVDGDLGGFEGVGRFEIDTTSEFENPVRTAWVRGVAENDFIIKVKVSHLKPGSDYYYRLVFGADRRNVRRGGVCRFKTLGGASGEESVRFVVVTGMNYYRFHNYKKDAIEKKKHLGYPALETILKMKPDFFVGTGDNVYFDTPGGEKAAKTEAELRRKYHEQFIQPRYIKLFAQVPTYWEKDDHDHRYNDNDNTGDREPSSQLGIRIFKEQLPVVDPDDPGGVTYRTHRVNKYLQIWFVEGRDYRSPNAMPDGPNKSIWGKTQMRWLKRTLLASEATFKILISPTPMVGPDDVSKKDNHTNPRGFRYEADAFFGWLKENGFLDKHFYILCGDRHWQYHSIHPLGFEEFSSGALIDGNSRVGRKPGDPKSTDPDATIVQPYCMTDPTGGFLMVSVTADPPYPQVEFGFYDEKGSLLYSHTKTAE
ncbi:MAG: alkaline phosphatase D family protein [Planctomycetes bacterium]|nr:alkaline phosphatase D family protein [Planctomycetota bacterium]